EAGVQRRDRPRLQRAGGDSDGRGGERAAGAGEGGSAAGGRPAGAGGERRQDPAGSRVVAEGRGTAADPRDRLALAPATSERVRRVSVPPSPPVATGGLASAHFFNPNLLTAPNRPVSPLPTRKICSSSPHSCADP